MVNKPECDGGEVWIECMLVSLGVGSRDVIHRSFVFDYISFEQSHLACVVA